MLSELRDLFNQALVFDWRMHTKEDVSYLLERWDEAEIRTKKALGLPAAEVHAHWYVLDGCAYCSNCRNNFKKAIMTHARYCPSCGAKMDLPEPPKEEAPTGPYDLLYEEGGANTT